MKRIMISIGLYLIKQDWFQFAVVKSITKLSMLAVKAAEETENTLDDNLIEFIKRNKEPLINIIQREINWSNTPIDNMLLDAIANIK